MKKNVKSFAYFRLFFDQSNEKYALTTLQKVKSNTCNQREIIKRTIDISKYVKSRLSSIALLHYQLNKD